MTSEHDGVPKHLTFSQRYGYEPLPKPMRLEEISGDLRREIWNAVRALLMTFRRDSHFRDSGARFVERVLGRLTRRPESYISTRVVEVMRSFEGPIVKGEFNEILDLLEIIVDELPQPDKFVTRIDSIFKDYSASYRLDMSRPHRFFPCASREQGEAIQKAIETIRENGMDGAATHLRQAMEHTNAGQYADSIADSIHAVESVARTIDPNSSKTLGPALDSLEKAGVLKHPALKQAFDKLYGYTNTEQGIRHALLDKGAVDVGVNEAIFMFGACASFAAYLTEKHRQAKGA